MNGIPPGPPGKKTWWEVLIKGRWHMVDVEAWLACPSTRHPRGEVLAVIVFLEDGEVDVVPATALRRRGG